MNYKHINIDERACIENWRKNNVSISEIARRLNRNKSSISRELKRCKRVYSAIVANKKSKFKRLKCHRKILVDLEVIDYIRKKLELKWSPEQIIGEYYSKYGENLGPSLSTIYRYIKRRLFRLNPKWLRHSNSKHSKKNITRYSNSRYVGELQPNYFEFGHWEADTIVGENHGSYMLTVCEKLTGLTFVKKLNILTAEEVKNQLLKIFNGHNLALKAQSITFDNGWEFAKWEEFEQESKIPVYFTKPGAPWEKPTIEYTNKLLRQWFPKHSNLNQYEEKYIELAVILLNNRPRKKLGFKSPNLVFKEF